MFREARKIKAAHGNRGSGHTDTQKPTSVTSKKYVFLKYGGARDRVITKKTQMVHPCNEEEDESKEEAVVEIVETPETAEPTEVKSTPEVDAQENAEMMTNKVSLTIAKALVTSLQQQKGAPETVAEKRRQSAINVGALATMLQNAQVKKGH